MSDKETKQGSQPQTSGLEEAIVFKTEAERLKEEQAEEKRRENRYHKRQLFFNGILTVATVVTAGIITYQGCLLRDYTRLTGISAEAAKSAAETARHTLEEIKKGGSDTHDLAVSAGKQADAGKVQTEKMSESLGKTDSLIQQTTAQAKATGALATEAQQSFALQSRLFEIEQRPYIWVKEYHIASDTIKNESDVIVKSGIPTLINVFFINGGKGIADNVDPTNRNCLIAPSEKLALLAGMRGPNSNPNHGGFLAPSQQNFTTVSCGIFSPQDVVDITTGVVARLYVFGSILYSDTGNLHHYRTNWCTTVIPHPNGASFGVCEYGNTIN